MPAVAGVTANASPNVRRSLEDRLRRGHDRALRERDDPVIPASAGRFACANVASDVRAHLVAAGAAALWSAEARNRSMVAGACTVAAGGVDRNRPLVADHIPVQLVVIGEGEERALHGVGDVVGVDAGDRAVRIADAHLQERSVLGDRRVVGCVRASETSVTCSSYSRSCFASNVSRRTSSRSMPWCGRRRSRTRSSRARRGCRSFDRHVDGVLRCALRTPAHPRRAGGARCPRLPAG